jgi:BlaI family transcriptional regulator, penicillinase repressor
MARPKAVELTDRELAVMQLFWKADEMTADQAREQLEETGESLSYVTVANVVRALEEKGFLKQTNAERPFRYQVAKSFNDVARKLTGSFLERLFGGSRQAMLVHLLDGSKLTKAEREFLQNIVGENKRSGRKGERDE